MASFTGDSKYHVEMFTLVPDRDKNEDPLFHIVPALIPVSIPVPFSVNKP